MKYISSLIAEERNVILDKDKAIIPCSNIYNSNTSYKLNLIALGDVGGTVLQGLRLLGENIIEKIGIYDLNPKALTRYEREINQICYPDCRTMPFIEIGDEDKLYECDVLVFCASKGVPPVGALGDVRMAQLKANGQLVSSYAKSAVKAGFKGIFAIVSDPVDPLCKAAVEGGLLPEQVQGYGLGVMHGRAAYFAKKENKYSSYLKEGRAFGPHGEDLVIANSIYDYNENLSIELTELAVNSNMETRADGFKPYIAPALSSAAISITETLKGNWNYSSVYFGNEKYGAFLGCKNRRSSFAIEVENLPLDDRLYDRISKAYKNLISLNPITNDNGENNE